MAETPDAVSLREYIEAILHEQDRALQALAASQERALQVLATNNAREVATLAESTEREVKTLAAAHAREVAELKANVNELARLHSEAHAREHGLTQTAVEKAEQSLGVRLEGMNELRAQITGERGTYVTRDMLEAKLGGLDGKVEGALSGVGRRLGDLENKQANLDGRFLVLGGVLAFGLVVVEFVARMVIK
jgi:hypothetical protein